MADLLYFNGVNGATGTYGLSPMTSKALSDHVLGIEERQSDDLASLEARVHQEMQGRLGLAEGIDPKDLGQSGWGVIFGAKNPLLPQIKEALSPLLQRRQGQTEYFQVYEKGRGYRPGETARKFLSRAHNADLSKPADPAATGAPYYFLIVGDPQEIPYRFQYQLDVQYAVGRLDFGDDLEAYARYAQSVVESETGDVVLAPKAAFFGVANPDDQATNLSADHLVHPMHQNLSALYPAWQIDAALREQATKNRLLNLIGGQEPPALLFTASHGIEFPLDDPQKRQVPHQGAILCQDWPGPNAWRGEIPQDFYLAGDDLAGDANLLGMVAVFFACYGAGTPLYDEFSKQAFQERREIIAERPFTAALPRALLNRPKGGALAVVGHVERAWGNSFLGSSQEGQITVFESSIKRLIEGHPVGSAMEYFNGYYAGLSTQLTVQLEAIDSNEPYDPYELAGMWTANNDARSYIVIGDPAVRLRVATPDETATGRHDIQEKTIDVVAPPSIKKELAEGQGFDKPEEISAADWQQTPLSVKKYIKKLQDEFKQVFGTLG